MSNKGRHPSYVIPCPSCERPEGLACVTSSGRTRHPHPTRLRATGTGKLAKCPCGGGELHYLCGRAVHAAARIPA